jgi:hypothetical protein
MDERHQGAGTAATGRAQTWQIDFAKLRKPTKISIRSGISSRRTAFGRQTSRLRASARFFEMLVENPLAGRERRELRDGLRSFPVGNYVIFYVPLPDGVEIIRVMHGRQDVGSDDMQ